MITGASRGIGRYLAQHYSNMGIRVVGCSRGPVSDMPDGYRHFSLDITNEQAVLSMFMEVKKTFSRLDALINNAAVYKANHCLLTPLKSVQEVMDTNVSAAFLMCREAAVSATLGRSITGRPVLPADIAHAMDFFISEQSARITGQTVYLE
jgi:3-oxoacyl-[acyl-carrier protein] reductase